jgi:acetyl esterase
LTANRHNVVLEAAALSLVEATDPFPHINDLGPVKGREALKDLQKEPAIIDVDERWITLTGGPTGWVWVRIVTPPVSTGPLPVVI